MALIGVALLFLSCVSLGRSYSSGPPTLQCTSLTPGYPSHPNSVGGSNPGGFYIYSDLIDCNGAYNASQAYTIRLQGGQDFKGFIIQARQSGTSNLIGTFSNLPSGTQLMGCGGSSTVSHDNANSKSSITVTWTAPASTGTLEIRYTVVVSRSPQSIFYANMNAASFRPSGSSCTLNSPAASSSVASSSVAPTSTPAAASSSTQGMPSSSSMPPTSSSISPTSSSISPTSSSILPTSSSAPPPSSSSVQPTVQPTNLSPACPSTDKSPSSDFPIVFKSPTNCDRASCTFYWAMGPNSVNSQYLDVYMEGTVDGWMAVGFSLDQSMGMDDVLGCKIENNAVTVLDTWNPNGYNLNQADSNSSAGICTHSTSYTNGRMSCLFSRSAGITNQGQDYNLDSSYYIISAYRTTSQSVSASLAQHSSTPSISPNQYNPMRDTYQEMPTSVCPNAPSSDATYPFRVGNPGDSYYFAARFNSDNSSFIDMRLEGNSNGWLAVGFTRTRSMYDADVVGCKRDPADNSVSVIDTWNPSTGRSNLLDASQSGVCRHSSEYSNGRISCTFSKYVGVIDNGQDLDLNDTLYRIYNAYSSTGGLASEGLSRHDITPSFSRAQTNLLTDIEEGRTETVDTWPKQQLLKTHGTFMTIAWLALAMSGAFFAAWMKPTLPNGEWFIAHRIFMAGSLIVGLLGFILPFIAHARSPTPGLISFSSDGKNTAHFVIGFIIMILHIANPIIALFRCNPKGEKRWIFNLTHAHIIGYTSLCLSLINIALGAHLLDRGNYEVAGFYIGFIILLTLFQVFLFIIHAYNARKAPEKDRPALVHSLLKYKYLLGAKDEDKDIQLDTMKGEEKNGEEKKEPEKPEKKKPLESALVRTSWVTVAVHLIAIAVAVVVMILLIAIN